MCQATLLSAAVTAASDQVGDPERNPQVGPVAMQRAAVQGDQAEDDGGRPEDDVEDQQADQTEDEGRHGEAVRVAPGPGSRRLLGGLAHRASPPR
ncbi:hypothetical protein [Streptomyces sp. SAS_275]|uniref:hypothetical protein n=1 Tax=Streptomyces sp. SAS_275 TaxID=3412746 RepID=UPI00403C5A66